MRATLLFLLVLLAIVAWLAYRRRPRVAMSLIETRDDGIGSLEGDRAVLKAMVDAGADLAKPTEVRFYLYFETEEDARAAAGEAASAVMTPSVDRAAMGPQWLCLVVGEMVPDEEALHVESRRLQTIAAAYSGEFDGWEAALTR